MYFLKAKNNNIWFHFSLFNYRSKRSICNSWLWGCPTSQIHEIDPNPVSGHTWKLVPIGRNLRFNSYPYNPYRGHRWNILVPETLPPGYCQVRFVYCVSAIITRTFFPNLPWPVIKSSLFYFLLRRPGKICIYLFLYWVIGFFWSEIMRMVKIWIWFWSLSWRIRRSSVFTHQNVAK